MSLDLFIVSLTGDERDALIGASYSVPNISFGGASAPAAILSARAKLEGAQPVNDGPAPEPVTGA